ncbi:hypothetical protein [Devosia sp.]|jgi:hypothetical protein|uniref:hypothetical protein n=1 Tax=Devosia sp. TaxID=1871048 RepID=UPI0037C071E9
MLMKADSPREYARSFAEWRAMLPHWNAEADRLRKLALELRAGGAIHRGAFDDAELLVEQVRNAMIRADSLMATCVAGDSRLSSVMRASSEFGDLLESFQKTLEIADEAGPARRGAAPQIIAQRLAAH